MSKQKFYGFTNKKGFSRGGHYHKVDTEHTLISGKIEYREEDIQSGDELIKIISIPSSIVVPANKTHLFTAIEDSVFIECFDKRYEDTSYTKYRKIVEGKIKSA